jgi:hypothetical protein
MIVKNTKGARIVREVAATMAISNMYMDKAFILKLIKVADGEMSSEELREEIMTEYRADTEENLHYLKNH